MNSEEQKVYTFIMDRTKPEHQEAMKQLVAELLERKKEHRLDKIYLLRVVPKALSYLQPEAVNEVKELVLNLTSTR